MRRQKHLEYSLICFGLLTLFLIGLQLRDVYKYEAKLPKDIVNKIFHKTIIKDKIVHWVKIENSDYYLVIEDRKVYQTKFNEDLEKD